MLLKAELCFFAIVLTVLPSMSSHAQEPALEQIQKQLQAVQAEIESVKSRPPKLKCRIVSSPMTAPPATNAEAKVLIPAADLKTGYTLVGGGCYMLNPVNILRRTSPTGADDGWRCELADVPGMRADSSVQAVAIYCRVE